MQKFLLNKILEGDEVYTKLKLENQVFKLDTY